MKWILELLRQWFVKREPEPEVKPEVKPIPKYDPTMKLSDNFWLHEFIRSETAIREDIEEQFFPPSNVISNLSLLCREVLQPLRVELQARMFPTSGYRCERLNTAVGGSDNSDHIPGRAADVTCKNVKMLYDLCKALDLPFKQLIWYKKKNFVHISYDENEIRKQNWEQ